MSKTIEVCGRTVGFGQKVVIIAEVGVNHNGDLDLALEMIESAASCGADIVKFQTIHPEGYVIPEAPKAGHQLRDQVGDSQLEMLKRMDVGDDWYPTLFECCDKNGVGFLSTPYEESGLELLLEVGVDALKTDSANLTNLRFLSNAAATGLPLLVSTGMATVDEIDDAVGVLRQGQSPFMLLHCVSSYPAPVDQLNLRVIKTLEDYEVPVGYSDHCPDAEAALGAVVLGACLLEKHFTTDKGLPGPDQKASADPDEFRKMVGSIRRVEQALGQDVPAPRACETESREKMRRSLCLSRDLKSGHILVADDLKAMRPGTGVSPARLESLVGQAVVRDLPCYHVLSFEDVTTK